MPAAQGRFADGVVQAHEVAVEQVARVDGRGGQDNLLAQGRGGVARAGHAQHVEHLRRHQRPQQRPAARRGRKPGEQVSHSVIMSVEL